jgi:aromatic ring-opening dioxygenase catalytic subunit (LigB family)
VAGGRGFDGGKKIKGIKRHIIVDAVGLILTAGVHTAGIHDYQGALLVLRPMFPSACPRLVKILADEGMISLASIRSMLRKLAERKADFHECGLAWGG